MSRLILRLLEPLCEVAFVFFSLHELLEEIAVEAPSFKGRFIVPINQVLHQFLSSIEVGAGKVTVELRLGFSCYLDLVEIVLAFVLAV